MRRLSNVFTRNFTERNPVIIGAVAIGLIVAFVVGAITLNRNVLGGGMMLTGRFTNAAGLRSGDQVILAGVPVGTVQSLGQTGDSVFVRFRVSGSVQIPEDSALGIQVETLLGQLALRIDPGHDWSHLVRPGATMTRTSVPVEFQQLQNATGPLLARSNAPALNQLLGDLAAVTHDKQSQVATIISGLDRLTAAVNQRQAQVSQLIDASQQVSGALADRDQQLRSAIDNFDVVLAGLAQRRAALSALIVNTRRVADQTASLVGDNRTRLDQLLGSLQTALDVVAAHQVDLAQGVSYLAAAIQGFSSIGYSGSFPNSWANIYTNLIGGGDPVYGSCGYMDAALDAALGPDPRSCSSRQGPQGTTAATSSPALSSLLGRLVGR